MVDLNKIYRSRTSVYKIVERLDCKNNPCYHIKLRYRGILCYWGELPHHYTLEETEATITNLIELDRDGTRKWFWWIGI